jgi:uncharacterized protein YabN with tetrapyrrole methylase and pyrophosphatase domain
MPVDKQAEPIRHLDIVGFGIGGASNITLRVNALIKFADCVFTDVASPGLSDYLRALDVDLSRVIDLLGLTQFCRNPRDIYELLVQQVFSHSSEWHRAVLIEEGHPQLFNTPVHRIVLEGRKRGWDVVVHPAISSLDTMLIDLDLQIEEQGLLILDAARMIRRRQPLLPSAATLILQLGGCMVKEFIDFGEQTPDQFEPLANWLGNFFPVEHRFVVLRSAIHDGAEASGMQIETTIGDLPQHAPRIDYYCSGYIPPVH